MAENKKSKVDKMALFDEEFIQKLVQGDEKAYNLLYSKTKNLVYKRVTDKLGTDSIDDIVQDIYIKIIENIGSFEYRNIHLIAWIEKIIRNHIIDIYRKREKAEKLLNIDDIDISNLQEDLNDEFQTKQFVNDMLERVKKLKPAERLLLEARLNGLSYQQISDTLGLAMGTVKKTIHDAKKKIKGKVAC